MDHVGVGLGVGWSIAPTPWRVGHAKDSAGSRGVQCRGSTWSPEWTAHTEFSVGFSESNSGGGPLGGNIQLRHVSLVTVQDTRWKPRHWYGGLVAAHATHILFLMWKVGLKSQGWGWQCVGVRKALGP